MVFTGVAWHRQGFYGRPGGATHLRSGTATDGGGRGEGRRLRHQQGCAQQRTARQCIAKARPAEAKRAGASCLRRRRERRACRRRGCALDGKSGGREKRGFCNEFPSPAEGGTVVDLATGATFHDPEGGLPQPLVGTAAVCNAAIDPSDPGCQASCRARCYSSKKQFSLTSPPRPTNAAGRECGQTRCALVSTPDWRTVKS